VGDSVIYESGGNIGIGASPGTKLDVSGHIAANAGYLYTGDGSNGVVAARQGSLFVVSNGTGAVLINANGNYLYPGQVGGQGGTGGLSVYSGGAANTQQSQIGGTGNTWFNAGNVGIGNTAPAAKVVINDGAANNGNVNDTMGIYSNKPSSALYVEQVNVSGYGGYFTQNTAGNSNSALFAQNTSSTGYAAYFAGAINVESNVFIGGSAVLKGIAKTSWPTQVCQVNGGACLGRYLGTVGTTTADLQFRYNNSLNQPTLTGLMYSSVPNSCANGWSPLARSTGTNSLFNALACTQFANEYALGGSGGYGSGLVCSEDAETEIMINRVLSSSGCATTTGIRTRLHRLEARFTATTMQYELR